MGLFDFLRSPGALSVTQNKEMFDQGINHPQYAEYMKQMSDPRNMDTGMKLSLLGQAMQGNDISGKITDYQSGIRDRFRTLQQDKRQAAIDELNRRQTELGMANTQNNMNIASQKLPGQLAQQDIANANSLLTGQRAQQTINQANVGQARWVGDHTTGRVMQMNPNTGLDEDVTAKYTPAQIEAFKAALKPKTDPNNPVIPGVGRQLNAAEKTRDKTFGKDIETLRPDAVAGNISMLNMIADQLSNQQPGEGATGLSWTSPLNSLARLIDREGDMGLRSMVDSQSIDTQELVAGVIQKNLRETLGAQFTQREGMLLIQRAYNPQLDPAVNAKRLKAAAMLADAYLKSQQKKLEYWNGNRGSLAGYDPKLDENLSTIEAQVRQIFMENGGVMGGNTGSGTSSTGVGWSVAPTSPPGP